MRFDSREWVAALFYKSLNHEQQCWIPGLALGQFIGGFALSEPDSGSDAGSLTTVAEYDAATQTTFERT